MKKWYQSKTIIFNIIVAVLGFLPMVDSNLLETFGVSNPEKYLKILVAIGAIGNYFLRLITNTGISTKLVGTRPNDR